MQKKILVILVLACMLVPSVNARFLDDDWFVDKAISNVETDHELEDLDIVWNGVVTSGFEFQWRPYVPLHKHATLAGSFGFANSGYVQWDGRVYVAPWNGVYELNYYIVKPRPAKLSTTVKNPQYQYVWNGKNWELNTFTVIVVDGRSYVTYDKPT